MERETIQSLLLMQLQLKEESVCSSNRTKSGRSDFTVTQIVFVSQSKYPCISRFRIAVICGQGIPAGLLWPLVKPGWRPR